jgi:hypothetical protein
MSARRNPQVSGGHGEKKSRKQELAIAALLSSPTILEASAATGVDESTMRRWLRDPAFCARYRAARRQAMEHSIAAMQCASVAAVATLVRNLDCGIASAEIASARTILEHAIAGIELLDLGARIEALEAKAAEGPPTKGKTP